MKAILVLDEMPNNCSECPCRNEEDFECNNQYKGYISDYLKWNSGRPSWCPLKPMPEKIGSSLIVDSEEIQSAYQVGWNDCVECILGEEE